MTDYLKASVKVEASAQDDYQPQTSQVDADYESTPGKWIHRRYLVPAAASSVTVYITDFTAVDFFAGINRDTVNSLSLTYENSTGVVTIAVAPGKVFFFPDIDIGRDITLQGSGGTAEAEVFLGVTP